MNHRALARAAALGAALALSALAAPPAPRGDVITVACDAPDPIVPDGWTVQASLLGWDGQGVFIRALTEGNCRIEEEEVCYPAPGGGTHCRIVEKEVCDEGQERFRFGPEVTVVEDRWVYLVREDAAPVIWGKAFKTFPYWNIVEFHGATEFLDAEQGCGVHLDLDTLGQSRRGPLFMALFEDQP